MIRKARAAPTGAATSPMARSLSSARRMAASTSATGRSSWCFLSDGSSSGRTMEYLMRSKSDILGAPSPPELPVSGLEGIGAGYRPFRARPFGQVGNDAGPSGPAQSAGRLGAVALPCH